MAGSPLCPPLRGDRDCASVRITKAMQSGALLVVLLWPMVCQGISPPPPPRQWFTACGGKVNGSQGFIQTPHFPGPFPVPLSCRWVIEAPADKGIALYFTQFYLREGLRATEYVDFESDSTFWGKRDFGVLSFDNRTTYLITYKPFLVLDLHVTDMSNINMRVVDFFLDVYGFNITYEIISKGGGGSEVRRDACSVFKCSFTGDCIATYNFRKYYCQCFPGFYGDDCQFGPRCDPDRKVNLCKNGRSCRYYIGSQVYACDCPPGFEGDKCESTACRNLSCSQQCIQRPNRSYQCGCYSGYKLDKDNKTCLPSGRIRYLVSIKLKEPTFDPSASNRSSPQYLQLKHKIESELTNFLKKRLGEIKNLTVLELQQDGQVKFHFFANLADSETARRLFLESMKRKKIAGIAIDEDHIQFEKEPALSLQSVYVKEGRALVAGKGMTLACIAVGTSSMEFLFFKDGVLVDVHKSHRHMWQTIIPKNSRDQYTAVLNIERVQPQDKGTYTCQVSDWGEAQRKSVSFHVITPPTINVTPVTATLNMYESLTITCQSHEDSDGSFGYNWAKNEHILNPSDGKEIVEDLFPTGSRVKIISATDSAVYTCIVSNNAGQTTQNSHVTVINPKNVHTCPEQESYNVSWSRTSPNSEDIHPCPMGFRGMAKRSCSMIVTGPMWEEADFSDCVSQELANIFKNFESLKLGFLATNVTRVLRDVLFLLQPRYNTLYPGEGKAVLDLMADVLKYEERYPPANSVVKLQHAELFLDIISLLLSSPKALNTPEKAMKLHREVLRETHVLASLVEVGKTTTARREPLVIEATRVPAQGRHSLHFPSKVASRSPDWLTDYLVTTVETSALMGQTLARENSTLEIAVVFYKNISRFLPRRYLAKFEHGLDVEYVVDSRVVALSVQKDKQEIGISPGSAQISVTFDHHDKHINKSGWNVTCGLANFSHGKPQWHLSGCSLSSADNFTQCFCDRFGTYAILLTTYIIPEEEELEVTFDLLIAICCIVCLGFLILTMLILMVCWRRIQGGFLILKLQLCLGLFGAVATFLGAARTSLNPESFPYMMTALEFFLLLPFSTQVCLELMLYLDMARTYRVKNARTRIIMIGWGIPLLVTGTTYAAQSLKGTPFTTWWITVDDIFFYGFVITSVILTILYLSLYLIISSELRHIRTVEVTKTKLTYPSGRLLQRTLVIQLFLTSLTVASISHVSSDSDAARYFFSASTGAMGFVVFLLYALNSDVPLCPCCQNGSKKENGASETPSRSESFRTFIKPDSTEECLSENNVVEYIERRKRAERLKRAQNNGTDTGPREAEDLLLHDVASKQNEHNSVRDDGGDNYMSGSCSKAALLEMVDLSGGGGNMNGKPPLPLRGKGDGLSRGLVLAEGTANNVDIIRYEGSPKKYPCVCGGGSSSIEYEGGTASTTCDYDDEDVDDRRGLIKPQRGTCYIRETPQSFPSRVDDPAASHAPAVMSSVPTVTSPKESGGPHVTFGPVFRVPFDAEDEEEEEVDEEEDEEEEGEEEEEEMDAKFSPKSLPLPPLHFQDNLPPPPSHSPPQVPALPPKLKPKHLPMDGIVHPFVLTRPRNPQESGSARTTDYPGDTVV